MIQIFLFLIAVCFISAGIVLMARSLKEPAQKKLSPQEEATLKINSFLSPGSEPVSSNLLTNHILGENLKKQSSGESQIQKKDDVSQSKGILLQKELDDLKEKLSSKAQEARIEVERLTHENKSLSQKYEDVLRESEEVKTLLDHHRNIQQKIEAELVAVRQSCEELQNKEREKFLAWEVEKQKLIEQADLLREGNANAVTLKFENEQLRGQFTEIQAKINTVEENLKAANERLQVIEKEKDGLAVLATRLQEEKHQLLAELQKAEGKFSQLQENFDFLKKSNQEKWQELREESQEVSSRLGFLAHEKEMFEDQKGQLEQKINDLTKLNAQLFEKEKFFQRELFKARTQNIGLEKICIDFKSRIEETKNPKEKVKV